MIQETPFTIYLCGPIHGRTDEQCVAWRERVKKMWPGYTLDPLRRDYRGREHQNPEKLIREDLSDVFRADGLLVYFDAPSVGTSMEIFYAKFVLNKPIVLLDVSSMDVLPVWLTYHVDSIHREPQAALETLNNLIRERRAR